MVINSVKIIEARDIAEFCWQRLAQFRNIQFTSERISYLHQLSLKDAGNARKQAEQIKYCLTQAEEYFHASKVVSLATRPLLQYYCVMSLALVEVLLKQNAESRLSKLRANHNCHGLTLSLASDPSPNDTLNSASEKMMARPQFGSNAQPKGTFEVWRRSAREYPTAGYFKQLHGQAYISTFKALLYPADSAPPTLPSVGISLNDCLTNLPYMADTLSRWGSRLRMVRTAVSVEKADSATADSTILIVHPTPSDLFNSFASLCVMHPEYVNATTITEIPNGYIFRFDGRKDKYLNLPHSTSITSEEVFFSCSSQNLGEFGYLYVALHLLGNFARYYPDLWMKHIDSCSPLASAAEDLCTHALSRLPLLSLSELSREYHVLSK
jgi:YaaC-like Protein